jgi:hypothetical protein
MSPQRVVRRQLIRNLDREFAVEASAHVDPRQLGSLGLRRGSKFIALLGEISPLGIRLGADRNVLARCHGEGAGYETCHRREQDGRLRGLG